MAATVVAHRPVNDSGSVDRDRHSGSASSSSTERTSSTIPTVSETTTNTSTTSSGKLRTAYGGDTKVGNGENQRTSEYQDDKAPVTAAAPMVSRSEGTFHGSVSATATEARHSQEASFDGSPTLNKIGAGGSQQSTPSRLRSQGKTSRLDQQQRQSRRWSSSRYQRYEDDDEDDDDSCADAQENTPIQYPPMSEDDREARSVEQNLERWATEEKLRRKAARSSKTATLHLAKTATASSTNLHPDSNSDLTRTPSKLAKRFSHLGRLHKADTHRDSIGSAGSSGEEHSSRSSQMSGSLRSASTLEDVPEHGDWGETDAHEERRRRKGKERVPSDGNPFSDTSSTSEHTVMGRSQSIKPTPKRPIVTPGRAPTIRHKAIENARKSSGAGTMPAIVATDTDQEELEIMEMEKARLRDPFRDASEGDVSGSEKEKGSKRWSSAHVVLQHGDDGYDVKATAPPHSPSSITPMRPSMLRKSTSDSRFNEIGLDDEGSPKGWPVEEEEEEIRSNQMRPQKGMSWRQGPNSRLPHDDEYGQGQRRKPWWSEWLCGCGDMQDPNEEQVGVSFGV